MPNQTNSHHHDSLYVHVPFCTEKCGYCAFYSVTNSDLTDAYLRRLAEEIRGRREDCDKLRSLYIGGGTPNSLLPRHLAKLLNLLRESFELADDCEFSTEMNPSSHTSEKLDIMLEHGVNRFSAGIQSFSPAVREAIGRCGDIAACHRTLNEFHSRGIENFGCDMIFAVPGQTAADWQKDLRELLVYHPKHISTYSLTIDPETPIALAGLPEISDDLFIDQWDSSDAVLGDADIVRYEISNFAQPGCECRHNDEIWHGHPFMAVGPAAHWFDGRTRWANPDTLQAWIGQDAPVADRLSPEERAVEILIVGLRTARGWNLDEFEKVTGFDALELRQDGMATLAEHGLLQLKDQQIIPTRKGMLLGNALADHLW